MRRDLYEIGSSVTIIGLLFYVFTLHDDLHHVKVELTSAKEYAFESDQNIERPFFSTETSCGAEVEITCTGKIRGETPMHIVRYHCDPKGCHYECGNEK